MKSIIAPSVCILFLASGCAAMFTEQPEPYTGITAADVTAMSEAGVPSAVIIRKIEVSGSEFHLGPDDVISLQRAGVSGEVLRVMLGANDEAREADLERGYDFYEYWFNYYTTHYPSVLPFPRYYPGMSLSHPGLHPLRYQWTGGMEVYYSDFPVGLPGMYRGRNPVRLPFMSGGGERKE